MLVHLTNLYIYVYNESVMMNQLASLSSMISYDQPAG